MHPQISQQHVTNGNTNVILLGDSIFDNQPYVGEGESVSAQLSAQMHEQDQVQLLAIDGAVIADVHAQLDKLADEPQYQQQKVFLSCGGNDLLGYRASDMFSQPVTNIIEALQNMTQLRERFRQQYQRLLDAITQQCAQVSVCTIYNAIPNLPSAEKTALALFNEVILQEAMARNLAIIDLRTLCNESQDYAPVSPIEPSRQGAHKIATAIYQQCHNIT